jgi:hypothetical protein
MSKVIVNSDQGLIDIMIQETGSIDQFIALLANNNLGPDSEPVGGAELTTTGLSLAKALLNTGLVFYPMPEVEVMAITVNNDQNLIDLITQESGSVEGLVSLLKLNNLAPDDLPSAGSQLTVKGLTVIKKPLRDFYRSRNYKVNTGSELGAPVVNGLLLEDESGYLLMEDGSPILMEE